MKEESRDSNGRTISEALEYSARVRNSWQKFLSEPKASATQLMINARPPIDHHEPQAQRPAPTRA